MFNFNDISTAIMPSAHDPFSLGDSSALAMPADPTPDEIAVREENNKNENFKTALFKFRGMRALRVWEALALSLGQAPYRNKLKKRKTGDGAFLRAYRERLRFLTSRLADHPQAGLALHLTNHPKNDVDDDLDTQMVDAVSALILLRGRYGYFPPELDDFEASIHKEHLFTEWHALPTEEYERVKRDQAKRITAGLNKNMQLLLIQVVNSKYGTLTDRNLDGIAKLIEADIKSANSLGFEGIQTQLRTAISGYSSQQAKHF